MARYQPQAAGAPLAGVGATNHTRIQETIRHLETLGSRMGDDSGGHVDAMEVDHSPSANHLAAPMRHLGAPLGTFLGLDADHLAENSERELCGKVITSAMNPNWANWDPKGDFISPNLF